MHPVRCFYLAFFCLGLMKPASAADLITFWDQPQRGGNSFNEAVPDQAYFDALANTGASWVRLTFSKWHGAGQDFLLGSADSYQAIPAADLALLRGALDRADKAGLKVVLAPLSLPGARWQQQNKGVFDQRLWSDPAYADQAVAFWSDLAAALRDHPAIAAYNLLNEPAPERGTGLAENGTASDRKDWYQKQQGTARDLPALYEKLIAAIRKVDPLTPVMLDAGFYANALSFDYWPSPLPAALSDARVLYAFHMYEPYEATSSPNMKRAEPYRYPGVELDYGTGRLVWDKEALRSHISAPFDWARTHDIPVSRMVAAEFGCMRFWQDCGRYLEDVTDILEEKSAHWAFYAFREDVWDGMDYELSPSEKSGRFYWLMEEGRGDTLKRNGPLFKILGKRLKP
ncbi:glycoside hydrolase family 5 protein [Kiloniella laminariae]|uniref:glycoside hydrolase family 5 protein n=1 Tax=Kiloniella laminariae TaxID=454162 RepID=UPI0003665AEF|nr:cellulase family glycosylhydrolase [Kiloniella laminariae]